MSRRWVCMSFLCCWLDMTAQEQQGVTLSGSVQSDILMPQDDERTGARKTEDLLTNTYVELMLQSQLWMQVPEWSILSIRFRDSRMISRGGVFLTSG